MNDSSDPDLAFNFPKSNGLSSRRNRPSVKRLPGTSKVSKEYFNDGSQTKSNSKPGKNSMIDKVVETVSKIPPEDLVRMAKTATNFVDRKRRSGRGSSDGANSYGLSKAPNPKETTLDSGIIPKTYVSDYLEAKENLCAPLHMTCARIIIPTSATQLLYDYFLKIISFDIQSKAQSNVGFNLNVGTDFTAEKILSAVNSQIFAFQVYFYYMSIISYHSAFDNKNEGMINMRSFITSDMLSDLSQLGRRLADTPVPPRLYELIRYMSGTYYTGPNQGSPLIKLSPLNPSASMVSGTDILSCLADISSSSNNQVYTLLRRAVPQWTPKTLYDVDPYPCYDANFSTIFANLPFVTGIVGLPYTPVATTTTDTIAYNSFTNVLDGISFSLTSIRIGNFWQPGLIQERTQAGFTCNRRSYYEVSGVKQWVNSVDYPFISRCRPETYIFNDSNSIRMSLHLPGADKCLQVCSDTIRETAMESLDYLMSLDTIKKSMSDDRGRNKFKRG